MVNLSEISAEEAMLRFCIFIFKRVSRNSLSWDFVFSQAIAAAKTDCTQYQLYKKKYPSLPQVDDYKGREELLNSVMPRLYEIIGQTWMKIQKDAKITDIQNSYILCYLQSNGIGTICKCQKNYLGIRVALSCKTFVRIKVYYKKVLTPGYLEQIVDDIKSMQKILEKYDKDIESASPYKVY